jgi:hypothetical protein
MLINLLNTNIIDESREQDSQKYTENNISIDLLKKLLKEKILRKKINNLSFVGKGTNGFIYELELPNKSKVICKIFNYNQHIYKQILKEYSILNQLTENKLYRDLINPCINMTVVDNYIITLFNVFKGFTLKELIYVLNNSSEHNLNEKQQILLRKLIIKLMCINISKLHDRNVAHLQINDEAILIMINNNLLNSEIFGNKLSKTKTKKKNINNRNNELNLNNNENYNFNTNTDINLENENYNYNENVYHYKKQENKFKPTNQKIYRIEYMEKLKPVILKFTNFGLGCGKILLSENFKTTKQQKEKMVFNVCDFQTININDPFLNQYLTTNNINLVEVYKKNNKEQIFIGIMLDIWMTGLLILKLILKKTMLNTLETIINSKSSSNTLLNFINDLQYSDLLYSDSNTFNYYLDNLKKYILCQIYKNKSQQRRFMDFFSEKVVLDEKHN